MSLATKLRLLGAVILLFNLWLIGRYNIQGVAVLLMTFGFAVAFEFAIVRPVARKREIDK